MPTTLTKDCAECCKPFNVLMKHKAQIFCSRSCGAKSSARTSKNLCREAGPEHPGWRGGAEASRERQRAFRRTADGRRRDRARELVREHIMSGRLTRQPCSMCNYEITEAHHEDYSKPLEVEWLCVAHHRKRHSA